MKNRNILVMIFLLTTFTLSASPIFAESQVVVEDTTTVYFQPSAESTEIVEVYPGTRFEFQGDVEESPWTKIVMYTGEYRYIRSGDVRWSSGDSIPSDDNYTTQELCRMKNKIVSLERKAQSRAEENVGASLGYANNEERERITNIQRILMDRFKTRYWNKKDNGYGIYKMYSEAFSERKLWKKCN